MKTMKSTMPGRQQGSFYSTVIIVAMFGLFLTTALKIAPKYIDNNVVVNAMESVAANNNLSEMNINEIRAGVMRTLDVNNINLDAQAIQLIREGNRDYVDINYEAKVPLFYNISAVVAFENRFDVQ